MSEVWTASSWLYSTLHGDATLLALCPGGIHMYPVPSEYSGQYVLYDMQSGVDIRGNGPGRIGVNSLWLVEAIAETLSYGGNLLAAADRIDALLHAKSGAATGGMVWACVRVEPFRLTEVKDGRQFRRLGGQYRIWVQ